jgi:hypothetical protein
VAKKKSGHSKKSADWLGRPITEHYNTKGEKTGYNKKSTNFWGTPITERYNSKGEKTGYNKKSTNFWGTPITERYNSKGEKTGYSKEGTTFWGTPIIEHYREESLTAPSTTRAPEYSGCDQSVSVPSGRTTGSGWTLLVAAAAVALLVLLGVSNQIESWILQQPPTSTTSSSVGKLADDIRHVDFLTFQYPSGCAQEYANQGFGSLVQVSKGQWNKRVGTDKIYFGVVDVVYGDLTGTGQESVAVRTACGFESGNAGYEEIFIFSPSNGQTMLERLSPFDWDHEMWRVEKTRIESGQLLVSYYAGGSHASPNWLVTARFGWNGHHFVRTSISRKAFAG